MALKASKNKRSGIPDNHNNSRFFEEVNIGVDIENIGRFNGLTKEFLERVYTAKEISYCLSKSNPAQHYAGRFAGKEAVIKVLSGFGIKTDYCEIEIANNAGGAPMVTPKREYGGIDILISISHCDDKAIAFALGRKRAV